MVNHGTGQEYETGGSGGECEFEEDWEDRLR
jgi:hypothetical protein